MGSVFAIVPLVCSSIFVVEVASEIDFAIMLLIILLMNWSCCGSLVVFDVSWSIGWADDDIDVSLSVDRTSNFSAGRGGNTGALLLLAIDCALTGLGGTIGVVMVELSFQNKFVG